LNLSEYKRDQVQAPSRNGDFLGLNLYEERSARQFRPHSVAARAASHGPDHDPLCWIVDGGGRGFSAAVEPLNFLTRKCPREIFNVRRAGPAGPICKIQIGSGIFETAG
jgi:hypothetical protein